jgi:hypothetical protein
VRGLPKRSYAFRELPKRSYAFSVDPDGSTGLRTALRLPMARRFGFC